MPRKAKKANNKVRARHEMIDAKTENLISAKPVLPSELLRDPRKAVSFRWGVLVVLVLLILGAYWLVNRGYVVAALVNGKPIFTWEVNQAVMSRYGVQTLDSMISERLITDAAAKQNVVIAQTDVDAKIAGLVSTLGPNVKLEDVLQYQGMTKSEFEDQVRIQMMVDKILGKNITVSDSDVTDYIANNKDTLTATDDAGLKEEAQQAIRTQQISAKIQPWLTDLKSQAKIVQLFK
jgi:foldase protein PrsA